jgi:hypothetical protein
MAALLAAEKRLTPCSARSGVKSTVLRGALMGISTSSRKKEPNEGVDAHMRGTK